jgi:long-chain acyl-CoA synthetase
MITFDELTIAELCLRSSEQYAGRRAFAMFGGGAVYNQVSYRRMGIRARQIGSLLGRVGVGAGGRVLLLCENRPEWPLAYFGIALAGAVSVPVLTGFSPCQIRYMCEHAGVSAVCLSRAMASKIEGVPAPLIFIDSFRERGGETAAAFITVSLNGREQELPLRDPAEQGAAPPFPRRNADDLASIVYTSGTLGCSKGVMLSNRNLVCCARASRSLMPVSPRDRLLSVLPLAHTYECTLGLLAAVMSGASISYMERPPSPSVLLPAAKALRPTCMVTVPLLIEKIYRQHIAPALKASPLYRRALTRPLALLSAGRKLRTALGGSLRFLGIGGAPLSPETEDFLRKARFPYAPGYGLTETAPLVAGTAPFRFPLRSAGAIIPGLAVRVTNVETSAASAPGFAASAPGAIGEIQVRGPTVMRGYYRDEEQTRAAFTADGWLRTGDLGRLDRKGRLYVKGRLKALILGPSGENIYPEEIEGVLSASQLVEDALVYPGAKGELVALVRISESARAAATATAQAAVNALERALEELRVWANQRLAAFARVSRIELREEPFEKTPTFKIKRYLYGA